jgi:glycosyltransferase involved in cell wall biosynthesis
MARVSVIVPLRDEREHVPALVSSLAAQDFAGELEVLVGDDRSSDDSAALAAELAAEAGVPLRVVTREAGSTSAALNRCIAEATGELIVRMDCHSTYPPDYLRRCVQAADETGAWNVGGVVEARGRTPMERAVAAAMDSPFGGIGWTRQARNGHRVDVDTVTFGAFRPEAFRTAGVFDEALVRAQDEELNLRLRLAGGRIVLDPAIRVRYTPRGSLLAVARQYHGYGRWKVAVMLKHRRVLTARSLAPLAFVLGGTGLGALAPARRGARALLAGGAGLYGTLAVTFAAVATVRRGEPRLVARTALVFPAFHVGYGVGMLEGWVRAALGER